MSQFETVFGVVKSRYTSTRRTEYHHFFLADNPPLEPLFHWFKKNQVSSQNELKQLLINSKLEQATSKFEVRWEADGNFGVLHFHSSLPFNGNFSLAIPAYFKLFKQAISRKYNPKKIKLLKQIEKLEIEIYQFKETLKEEL